jgi:hypothetical protein
LPSWLRLDEEKGKERWRNVVMEDVPSAWEVENGLVGADTAMIDERRRRRNEVARFAY